MRTPVTFHVQNKLEKGEWESVSVFYFFFYLFESQMEIWLPLWHVHFMQNSI